MSKRYSFKITSWGEPEDVKSPCGQGEISYNPDDNRLYVCVQDKDYPGEWITKGTFAANRKGFENAVQCMKRILRQTEYLVNQ